MSDSDREFDNELDASSSEDEGGVQAGPSSMKRTLKRMFGMNSSSDSEGSDNEQHPDDDESDNDGQDGEGNPEEMRRFDNFVPGSDQISIHRAFHDSNDRQERGQGRQQSSSSASSSRQHPMQLEQKEEEKEQKQDDEDATYEFHVQGRFLMRTQTLHGITSPAEMIAFVGHPELLTNDTTLQDFWFARGDGHIIIGRERRDDEPFSIEAELLQRQRQRDLWTRLENGRRGQEGGIQIPQWVTPRAFIMACMLAQEELYPKPGTKPHSSRTNDGDMKKVLDPAINGQLFDEERKREEDGTTPDDTDTETEIQKRLITQYREMVNMPPPANVPEAPIPSAYLQRFLPRYYTPYLPTVRMSAESLAFYPRVSRHGKNSVTFTFVLSSANQVFNKDPADESRTGFWPNYEYAVHLSLMYQHGIFVQWNRLLLATIDVGSKGLVNLVAETGRMITSKGKKDKKADDKEKAIKYQSMIKNRLLKELGIETVTNDLKVQEWRPYFRTLIDFARPGIPAAFFTADSALELMEAYAKPPSMAASALQKAHCIAATIESNDERFPARVCERLTLDLMKAKHEILPENQHTINTFVAAVTTVVDPKKRGADQPYMFPKVYPNQQISVNWFMTMMDNLDAVREMDFGAYEKFCSGLALGDDVGAGKTLQSTLFIAYVIWKKKQQMMVANAASWRDATRILIVAPGITRRGWRKHLKYVLTAILGDRSSGDDPNGFDFLQDTQYIYRRDPQFKPKEDSDDPDDDLDASRPYKFRADCPITWADYNVFRYASEETHDFLCSFRRWPKPKRKGKGKKTVGEGEGEDGEGEVDAEQEKAANETDEKVYNTCLERPPIDQEYDLLIMDEVHEYRNAGSAFQRIIGGRAKCRIGLSATLTVNNVVDVICAYRLIAPGVLRHFIEQQRQNAREAKASAPNAKNSVQAEAFMKEVKAIVDPFFLARRAGDSETGLHFDTHCFEVRIPPTKQEEQAFRRYNKYLLQTFTNFAISNAGKAGEDKKMQVGEFFRYVQELQRLGAYSLSAVNNNPYHFRYILTGPDVKRKQVVEWVAADVRRQSGVKLTDQEKADAPKDPWLNLADYDKDQYELPVDVKRHEDFYKPLILPCELMDLSAKAREDLVKVWFVFVEAFDAGSADGKGKKATTTAATATGGRGGDLAAPRRRAAATQEAEQERNEVDEDDGTRPTMESLQMKTVHVASKSLSAADVAAMTPDMLFGQVFNNNEMFPPPDATVAKAKYDAFIAARNAAAKMYASNDVNNAIDGVDFATNVRNFKYPFISVKYSTAFYPMRQILAVDEHGHDFAGHMRAFGNKYHTIEALFNAAESDAATNHAPPIILKNIVFFKVLDNIRLTTWWLRILSKGTKDVMYVSGEIGGSSRDKNVDDFVNRKDNNFILMTYGTAGVGLSLENAHNLALFDYSWTFKDVKQAVGRITRVNQWGNVVNVFRLVAKNSYDSRLLDVIENKKHLWDVLYSKRRPGEEDEPYRCVGDEVDMAIQDTVDNLDQFADLDGGDGTDESKGFEADDRPSSKRPRIGGDVGGLVSMPRRLGTAHPDEEDEEDEAFHRLFYYIVTRQEDEFHNGPSSTVTFDGVRPWDPELLSCSACGGKGKKKEEEGVDLALGAVNFDPNRTGDCPAWQEITTDTDLDTIMLNLLEMTRNIGPDMKPKRTEEEKQQEEGGGEEETKTRTEDEAEDEDHEQSDRDVDRGESDVDTTERPRERPRARTTTHVVRPPAPARPPVKLFNVIFWPPVRTGDDEQEFEDETEYVGGVDDGPLDPAFIDVATLQAGSKAKRREKEKVRIAKVRRNKRGAGRRVIPFSLRREMESEIIRRVKARAERNGGFTASDHLIQMALTIKPPGIVKEVCEADPATRQATDMEFIRMVSRFLYYGMKIRSLNKQIERLEEEKKKAEAGRDDDDDDNENTNEDQNGDLVERIEEAIEEKTKSLELFICRMDYLREHCKIDHNSAQLVADSAQLATATAIRNAVRGTRNTAHRIQNALNATQTQPQPPQNMDRQEVIQRVTELQHRIEILADETIPGLKDVVINAKEDLAYEKADRSSIEELENNQAELAALLKALEEKLAEHGTLSADVEKLKDQWNREMKPLGKELDPDVDQSDNLMPEDEQDDEQEQEEQDQEEEEEGEDEEDQEGGRLITHKKRKRGDGPAAADAATHARAAKLFNQLEDQERNQIEAAKFALSEFNDSMEMAAAALKDLKDQVQAALAPYQANTRLQTIDLLEKFFPEGVKKSTAHIDAQMFMHHMDQKTREVYGEVRRQCVGWALQHALEADLGTGVVPITKSITTYMCRQYAQTKQLLTQMELMRNGTPVNEDRIEFILFKLAMVAISQNVSINSRQHTYRGEGGYAFIDFGQMYMATLGLLADAVKADIAAVIAADINGGSGGAADNTTPDVLSAYVKAVGSFMKTELSSYFHFYALFEDKFLAQMLSKYIKRSDLDGDSHMYRAAQTLMAICIYATMKRFEEDDKATMTLAKIGAFWSYIARNEPAARDALKKKLGRVRVFMGDEEKVTTLMINPIRDGLPLASTAEDYDGFMSSFLSTDDEDEEQDEVPQLQELEDDT